MVLTINTATAKSKRKQIENITISLDSLNHVFANESQNFNIKLDSLNQVISKKQQYFEFEMDNLNTRLNRLSSINH